MKYLKPFNESSGHKEYLNLDSWLPECTKFIEDLKRLSKISNGANIEMSILFINFHNFKEKIKVMGADYELSMRRFYDKWIKLKKLDISVYQDIADLIEDVCDDNDCFSNFNEFGISEKFNCLIFEFKIYSDSYISVENHEKIIKDIRKKDKILDNLSAKFGYEYYNSHTKSSIITINVF